MTEPVESGFNLAHAPTGDLEARDIRPGDRFSVERDGVVLIAEDVRGATIKHPQTIAVKVDGKWMPFASEAALHRRDDA